MKSNPLTLKFFLIVVLATIILLQIREKFRAPLAYCKSLANQCAIHNHKSDPVSLSVSKPKQICPCEQLIELNCNR